MEAQPTPPRYEIVGQAGFSSWELAKLATLDALGYLADKVLRRPERTLASERALNERDLSTPVGQVATEAEVVEVPLAELPQ